MTFPAVLVDVFGSAAFSGNPVAVITADGLDTAAMQRITQWLNLSETTFLLPPTDPAADYRVRIFTLDRELPFAGHPTLGTCHAWLAAGGQPRDPACIVQECGAGLIPIRRTAAGLAFAAPPLVRSGPLDESERAEVARILRIDRDEIIDSAWVDNGPGWRGVLLASGAAVRAIVPERAPGGRIEIGVVGPQSGGDSDYEVRAFFTDAQALLIEDPVTGSLNASLAQWLFATGRAEGDYVAAQGTVIGRAGRVDARRDGEGRIWIGGCAETRFIGTMAVREV